MGGAGRSSLSPGKGPELWGPFSEARGGCAHQRRRFWSESRGRGRGGTCGHRVVGLNGVPLHLPVPRPSRGPWAPSLLLPSARGLQLRPDERHRVAHGLGPESALEGLGRGGGRGGLGAQRPSVRPRPARLGLLLLRGRQHLAGTRSRGWRERGTCARVPAAGGARGGGARLGGRTRSPAPEPPTPHPPPSPPPAGLGGGGEAEVQTPKGCSAAHRSVSCGAGPVGRGGGQEGPLFLASTAP